MHLSPVVITLQDSPLRFNNWRSSFIHTKLQHLPHLLTFLVKLTNVKCEFNIHFFYQVASLLFTMGQSNSDFVPFSLHRWPQQTHQSSIMGMWALVCCDDTAVLGLRLWRQQEDMMRADCSDRVLRAHTHATSGALCPRPEFTWSSPSLLVWQTATITHIIHYRQEQYGREGYNCTTSLWTFPSFLLDLV